MLWHAEGRVRDDVMRGQRVPILHRRVPALRARVNCVCLREALIARSDVVVVQHACSWSVI